MRIERHDDVRTFFGRVAPFLERREAEHNLLLGFRSTLERDPHAYGPFDPVLLAVVEAGEIVGVATRTPPHNLVLSEMRDPAAVDEVVAALVAAGEDLPGAIGPTAIARRFAERWAAELGRTARVTREQRAYAATSVTQPTGVTGQMRAAGPADRVTALRWVEDFIAEATPDAAAPSPDAVLVAREVVLWEDGAPVSMAAYGSPTPRGIRIGPVYTPPELRRRGYASALTAALTADLLHSHRFCFLFTDLANPTSNAIYQRVGYRPVTDLTHWSFEP